MNFYCKLCNKFFKRSDLSYCKKCDESHCFICTKRTPDLAKTKYKCDKCHMYYFYASVSVITGWSGMKEKWINKQYFGAFSFDKYPTKSEIISAVTSGLYNDGDLISYSNLDRFKYEALL